MYYTKKLYSHLPKKPGVYLFKDEKGEVLYIGKASNLLQRVKFYFLKGDLGSKIKKLVEKTKKIDYFLADSEIEALILEANLIKKYQPKYNTRLKDDKRYPSIGITIKEEFPRVYYTRVRDETKKTSGVLFFGPFPNPATVKKVLKLLRKIFPFRSCKKLPKKPCLYFHLKLCPGPCFSPAPDYKTSILQLIKLLKGEKKSLLRELKRKMKEVAKSENFELAAKIKNQIENLEYITQAKGLEVLTRVDFLVNQHQKEVKELMKILKNYYPNITSLRRIESFDISNIKGRYATGSMVVFSKGEAEKSEYRRFKIKIEGKPNDVAMMKEVLFRRFSHREWEYPNLILIDGGKGQVGGALEVTSSLGIEIPLVGLAKKEEKIVIPKGTGFEIVKLPQDSPALHLLQRIRDEAHRFARAYHLKLRNRLFF